MKPGRDRRKFCLTNSVRHDIISSVPTGTWSVGSVAGIVGVASLVEMNLPMNLPL